MALAKNILQGGFSAGQAKALNGAINAAVTAAGTTIADAYDMLADINFLSTVGANSGVQLYNGEIGDSQLVYNGGANAVKVYPDTTTSQINGLGNGNAHTLATGTSCQYWKISATRWIAQLSA